MHNDTYDSFVLRVAGLVAGQWVCAVGQCAA